MIKKNKLVACSSLLIRFLASNITKAAYIQLNPTLQDDSLYIFSPLTAQEYDDIINNPLIIDKNTFIDYEQTDNGLVKHYYSYGLKSGIISDTHKAGNFSGQNFNTPFFGLTISSTGYGAAININSGNIGDIRADFYNNSIVAPSGTYIAGGAIYVRMGSRINSITGDFINNRLISLNDNYGGAIDNYAGQIGSIDGKFIGNYTISSGYASGGAIVNESDFSTVGRIGTIRGLFANNYIISNATSAGTQDLRATGGAINNNINYANVGIEPVITSIEANFYNNYAESKADAGGGAIYNKSASIGNISGSFIGNYVKTSHATLLARGGAIWSNRDLMISANGQQNLFSGNYTLDSRGKIYNAIYLNGNGTLGAGLKLNFNVTNNGSIIFDDNIDSSNLYDINITGDSTGKVIFKNDVKNTRNINVTNATLRLSNGDYGSGVFNYSPNLLLNSSGFDINNGYMETVNLRNYVSNNSYLHLDVNPDTMTADILNINGNVNGVTKLIVYATSDKDIRNQGSITFATSQNDNDGHENSFEIFRVYKSPFLYDVLYTAHGSANKEWGLAMNDAINPDRDVDPEDDPTNVKVAPEVIAFSVLHAASIEQTRSMVSNIRNKVAANKTYYASCCGLYDQRYDVKPLYNAWVNPIYNTANIKSPMSFDADIWGLEAGFDIQENANNKLGVFASYRQGKYDINGRHQIKLKDVLISSNIDSKIDIDSYISGLYYRYDRRLFWAFATVYGGIQQADIKTNDGVKSDTDGIQFGVSAEFGKLFALRKDLTLEPSFGLSYTQIDFDRADDNVGKSAIYKTIRQTEAQLATKLEKTYWSENGVTKIHFKPSIIQPITTGDSVAVTGMHNINTYDDNTLIRMEVGGKIDINHNLSGYSFYNYTFGRSYNNTTLGMGFNYNW